MKKQYKNKKLVNRNTIIILLSIITFLVVASISLSIISNMSINKYSDLRSDKDLTCYWTIDQNNNVNITWYRNGVQNITGNVSCTSGSECQTDSLSTVPNTQIYKNDIWMCAISFDNGTAIETQNISITILDTPPAQPKIYWSNATEIINITVQLAEDTTTTFIVNSSDKDNDNIDYIINDSTFCDIDIDNGNLSCNPTLETHTGIRTIRVTADTTDGSTHKLMNINVTPVNDAPRFNPNLTTVNLTEGQKFNYYITGTDEENNIPLNLVILTVNPLLNLTVTRINDTRFVIMLGNNETVTLAQAQAGPYNVTVALNDTDNITYNSKNTTTTFQVVGVSFNHLPNISYIVYNNATLIQGGSLDIYVNATDIDNQTLIFTTVNNALYPVTYTNQSSYSSVVENSSFAYAHINVTLLNNSHVTNRNFTLFVYDTSENATQVITLNITNVNDAPIIWEISNHSNNTRNNTNMSDLITYTGVLFKYKVNASDVDDLTYDAINSGIGTYESSNSSDFPINSSTGWMIFTPLTTGNFTFNITVTDRGSPGLNYTRVANIEVLPNDNPTFINETIIIYCNEYDSINWNQSCYYNFSANVSDADNASGDYVNLFETNSTIFTINSTTGIMNFSANQSALGNHSIILNITDTRGGMNSTIIYLIINNTNNPPIIQTPYAPTNMVVGTPYWITYDVTDLDLDLPIEYSYENLIFSSVITGPNTTIFSLNKSLTNPAQATLSIIPIIPNYEGNYSINITVTDYYGNTSSYFMSRYIYNVTNPPDISSIIPSGTPLINDSINDTTWIATSNFPGMTTNITIYENTTYTFNQTSTADTSSYTNALTYEWYYDGVLNSTASYKTINFNFFSNGTHNLTFIATDTYGSNSSFNWIITVLNVNRPPTYNPNSLENLTFRGNSYIEGYLTWSNQTRRFYDPDDDPDGVGHSTYADTSLIFTYSPSCPYANFNLDLKQLDVEAIAIGECQVRFYARDSLNSSLQVWSEIVSINITNVTVTEVEVPVDNPVSTTVTRPTPIPLPQEVEKPKPLQIITPKLVTTYKNSTIKIPIVVKNTWNSTLLGITLESMTNASNVSLYMDKTYIPRLETGESVEATLYVQNYKGEGHYEIQLSANVSVPTYTDTATIFINSAELKSEGDELENKISFTQDLLSSNPECQELNELLTVAKKELAAENYQATAKIVDSVLNGCKYLVNNAKQQKEAPSRDFIKTFEWKKSYGDYLILTVFGILFLASLVYIVKKDNPEQNF